MEKVPANEEEESNCKPTEEQDGGPQKDSAHALDSERRFAQHDLAHDCPRTARNTSTPFRRRDPSSASAMSPRSKFPKFHGHFFSPGTDEILLTLTIFWPLLIIH
jgi:hypothetical protein